jgi:hypothetical protein
VVYFQNYVAPLYVVKKQPLFDFGIPETPNLTVWGGRNLSPPIGPHNPLVISPPSRARFRASGNGHQERWLEGYGRGLSCIRHAPRFLLADYRSQQSADADLLAFGNAKATVLFADIGFGDLRPRIN